MLEKPKAFVFFPILVIECVKHCTVFSAVFFGHSNLVGHLCLGKDLSII